MRGEFTLFLKMIFILLFFAFISRIEAQDLSLNTGADIVSRYIWRGLNVNDQPNIQPSITLGFSNLQAGFWGSYGLTHQNSSDENFSVSQEIDTWLNYALKFSNEMNIGIIVTDYYYPQGGIKIGNLNNYNNVNGPGAHTIETGLSITGWKTFPLTLSGYYNVYNDKGKNAYFQVEYSTTILESGFGIFVGAAVGSKDNPGYYGTDKLNIINAGIKVTKILKISEDFSIPVFCSYILNPHTEISYLVLGISL